MERKKILIVFYISIFFFTSGFIFQWTVNDISFDRKEDFEQFGINNPIDCVVNKNLVYVLYNNSVLIFESYISGRYSQIDVFFPEFQKPMKIEIFNDLLFIIDRNQGILIYNISLPLDPFYVTMIFDGGMYQDLFVYEEFLYVADRYQGIKIFNITDLSTIEVIGIYQMSQSSSQGDFPYTVEILKDTNSLYAFVGDWDNGLKIIDVSNPLNPVKISQIKHDMVKDEIFFARDVKIYENLAFVASDVYGMKVINITNFETPEIIYSYESVNGKVWGIEFDDEKLYIASGLDGLSIYDLDYFIEFNPNSSPVVSTYKLGTSASDSITKVIPLSYEEKIIIFSPSQLFLYDIGRTIGNIIWLYFGNISIILFILGSYLYLKLKKFLSEYSKIVQKGSLHGMEQEELKKFLSSAFPYYKELNLSEKGEQLIKALKRSFSERNFQDLFQYYEENPKYLTNRYIKEGNLGLDLEDRLIHEANLEIRDLIEKQMNPTDRILSEINKKLEVPIKKGLKILK